MTIGTATKQRCVSVLLLALTLTVSSAVSSLAATPSPARTNIGGADQIFLPTLLLLRPAAPDLIITSISVIPNKTSFAAGEPAEVRVTVKNQGAAVTAGSFWVELYINPSSPPTAANQIWNTRCQLTPCFGLAWEVTSALAPDESITLSSLSLPPDFSQWPGYFAAGTSDLYAYADSFNPGVLAGAVAESNETNNRAELHGLSVTGPNPAQLAGTEILPRPVFSGE